MVAYHQTSSQTSGSCNPQNCTSATTAQHTTAPQRTVDAPNRGSACLRRACARVGGALYLFDELFVGLLGLRHTAAARAGATGGRRRRSATADLERRRKASRFRHCTHQHTEDAPQQQQRALARRSVRFGGTGWVANGYVRGTAGVAATAAAAIVVARACARSRSSVQKPTLQDAGHHCGARLRPSKRHHNLEKQAGE